MYNNRYWTLRFVPIISMPCFNCVQNEPAYQDLGHLSELFNSEKQYRVYLPEEAYFNEKHAVHGNEECGPMVFDNGLDKEISRAFSLKLDESNLSTTAVINATLPKENFSPKMGSAYLIDSISILQTSGSNDFISVTNRNGEVKWQMRPSSLTYRTGYLKTFVPNGI